MAACKRGWRVRSTYFFLLWILFFVGYLGRANYVMVLPLIQADLGLSHTAAGLGMSAMFFGYLLFQFGGTHLGLKLGPRKAMVAGLLFCTLFTACTGAVTTLAALVIVRAFIGAGETLHPVSSWVCLFNWFPRAEWGRANAVILTSGALAGVVTPLMVTGVFLAAGWQATFFLTAALYVVLAWLVWSRLRDRPEDHPGVSPEELDEIRQGRTGMGPAACAPSPHMFRLLANPGIVLLVLVYFLQSFAVWGFATWVPSYLVRARELGMVGMGLKLPLVFGTALLGMVLVGPLLEKLFRRRLRLFLAAIWIVGALAFYHAQATADVTRCIVYLSIGAAFGIFMFSNVFWNLPRILLPHGVFLRTTNLLITAGQLAGCIAPVALGWIIDNSLNGYDSAFIAIEAALLLAAALVLLVPGKKLRAEESGSA